MERRKKNISSSLPCILSSNTRYPSSPGLCPETFSSFSASSSLCLFPVLRKIYFFYSVLWEAWLCACLLILSGAAQSLFLLRTLCLLCVLHSLLCTSCSPEASLSKVRSAAARESSISPPSRGFLLTQARAVWTMQSKELSSLLPIYIPKKEQNF